MIAEQNLFSSPESQEESQKPASPESQEESQKPASPESQEESQKPASPESQEESQDKASPEPQKSASPEPQEEPQKPAAKISRGIKPSRRKKRSKGSERVHRGTPIMDQYWEIKKRHPDDLVFFHLGDFFELFFDDAVKASKALDIALTKRGQYQGEDIPMCGVPVHSSETYLARLVNHGFRVVVVEQSRASSPASSPSSSTASSTSSSTSFSPSDSTSSSPSDSTESHATDPQATDPQATDPQAEDIQTQEGQTQEGQTQAPQTTDPQTAKGGQTKGTRSKELIQRTVRRIVTAGTLTEDALLDARRHNYLAGICAVEGQLAIAWLDISTGAFFVQPLNAGSNGDIDTALDATLTRIEPGEILIDEGLRSLSCWQDPAWENRTVFLAKGRMDARNGRDRLQALYGVGFLDAFGAFGPAEIAAAGALVDYIDLTQTGKMPRISTLERFEERSVMAMDAATIRNLELFRSLSGERRGSLVATLDRTRSAAGGRLLRERLSAPWADPKRIERALNRVDFFLLEKELRHHIEKMLSTYPDLERSMARLSLGRGSPRDLGAIRDGLDLTSSLSHLDIFSQIDVGYSITARIPAFDELRHELSRALKPELPMLARDGEFIEQGYDKLLDKTHVEKDEQKRQISILQQKYAKDTKLPRLKIRDNRILGRFIEVPSSQASHFSTAPQGPFIHRQTMAGSVRFTTEDLAELDSKILHSIDRAIHIEMDLFTVLTAKVLNQSTSIAQLAKDMARLDVACSSAATSEHYNYCRPTIDTSRVFAVKGGRHPVVEQALQQQGKGFIANDCRLDPQHRIWLLTGPNMAGKSTFLRQNAIIAIMAQAGLHVPAKQADIGIIDRLFSRVGAGDDLARGRSTFMIEMSETASILNRAGEHSFVILDEVGRGTATFDGLSIAWASVEHLHEKNHCRTLFATHYHELTVLSETRKELELYQMRVREWQGDIVFLHEVQQGAATGSYGIHVARLAGMPERAVARAQQILDGLEQRQDTSGVALQANAQDLEKASELERHHRLCQELARIDPDALNPREALDILYRLNAQARKEPAREEPAREAPEHKAPDHKESKHKALEHKESEHKNVPSDGKDKNHQQEIKNPKGRKKDTT